MLFREDLLGQSKKAADDMSRVAGLDNQGIVGLQRQVMRGIIGVHLVVCFNSGTCQLYKLNLSTQLAICAKAHLIDSTSAVHPIITCILYWLSHIFTFLNHQHLCR